MRKRCVRAIFLGWMAILCLSLHGGAITKPSMVSAKALEKGDAYQVLALVNQVRASYGLPALQANSALMAAAQGHSDYQASIGSATHSGKGGSSPLQRALAAGYGGGAKVYVSENIYSGNNASPSQAVNWWVGDGIHLQTMINPNATDAGAGVAQNGNTVYYTLLVGYVAGSPGSGSGAPPAASGTKAPTKPPFVPLVTSTPNADGSIVHEVQAGQALWNIAAIYNIPLAELLALNGLTENSFIYP
ncbi:MAG: CAP domain-containing protein, partial [Desulfitobacteriaceae bacterium]|nr:CAP domain-containing protein [Desulfitobacteriaceae bacterium]